MTTAEADELCRRALRRNQSVNAYVRQLLQAFLYSKNPADVG